MNNNETLKNYIKSSYRLGAGNTTTENDLRTGTITSTGNSSYVGDIYPWDKAKEDSTGYSYIDGVRTVVNYDLLIAKINKLEEKVDKLTKLLESIVD